MGTYSLYDFYKNKDGTCKVEKSDKKKNVFAKLQNITQENKFYLALIGIILLAFAVNLIELVCSAGLPAIFTQVLSLNQLPSWQYYLYITIYIFRIEIHRYF